MAAFAKKPPGPFSPRVLKRLTAIFLPAALLTGAVLLALYYQELTSEQALYEQAGEHRVEFCTDIIHRELKSIASDLLYLANQAALRGFLAGRVDSRLELQSEYLLFVQQRGVYDQVRYLDASGQERIRVNYNDGQPAIVPEHDLQAKPNRYYFIETMRLGRGAVFVSPFDLNIEHDKIEQPLKPAIRFATPIFDLQGSKRGIVVLNYLGAVLLNKLADVSAGFSGTVWLVNHDGFYLRGPAPKDEWGFMLGHDSAFSGHYPDEWARLAESERGQFRTRRGLFTYRSLAPAAVLSTYGDRRASAVPRHDPGPSSVGLIVVARIPSEVLDGRANRLLRDLLLLCGVLLIHVLILTWYLAYAGALRRDHERDLAESAARLRSLSTRLLTAQEDERRSVSRDLHDVLGQVVTSVSLDLQRAAQAGSSDRKDELIGRALQGAGCLLDRIHEISTRLRPTLLDDLGLKDAVQSLLGEHEQRTGIVTRADLHFEPVQLPPAVNENIFRILQEALTNVAKHARAAEVFVGLRVADGLVTLTVRDAGVGLGPAALDGKRLGILGMRERAELLHGTFVVKSAPAGGTELQVMIPILQPAEQRDG